MVEILINLKATTMKLIKQYTAKIGTSKGRSRVCLWSTKLIDAGFAPGQAISIEQFPTGNIRIITTDEETGKKVSKVMNHGRPLPVIDLKTTRKLDISKLGDPGDRVLVTINEGEISIS